MELIKEQDAFILLSIIAIRARRTNEFNIHNLNPREALIGDFANYGMTEQRYRTSKAKLVKWKFITTKSTTKGTIATLLDNGIYDINIEAGNGQANETPTDGQRTVNGQVTTNKNVKKANNEKNANKNKHKEFVYLTDIEYDNLMGKFGETIANSKIDALNEYIGSTGKNYKSHYHTILMWARKDSVGKPVVRTKDDNDILQWNKNRQWVEQSDLVSLQNHQTFMSNLANPKFRLWAEEINPIIKEIK